MKKIIILCGIPCSGKTTYAEQIDKAFGHCPKILSKDKFRKKYKLTDHTIESELKITAIYKHKLDIEIDRSEDTFLILDNTHCDVKELEYVFNTYKEENDVYVIFFNTNLFKAFYRNIIRYFKTGTLTPFSFIYERYKQFKKIDQNKYPKLI